MKTTDSIYLDHAAATPVADFVLEAMLPYFSEKFYNPSSPYAPAVNVRREYEDAKQRLAESFGAKGDELIITAGATESINLAFEQVSRHVVTSEIEHPAVLESAKRREYSLAVPDPRGSISPESIKALLRPDTELVSIALANNELGTIQPLRKIAAIIEEEKASRREQGNTTPLLFHTDASQGFGQIDVHVARLGVDLLSLNAGKMYGPKQVGLLWAKSSTNLKAAIVGGGQERGIRSGTENVGGVIGFAEAASWATSHIRGENRRLSELRNTLESKLLATFSDAKVLGSKKHRLPGHLSIAFPGIDAERIIFLLENEGVYLSTGSACSANKHTASHVLTAIGLDEEHMNGSLRITLGRHTTSDQIEQAASKIARAIGSEYERMGRL
ncbi:MAG TPA: cysteine desulfurase family protein [Candidatus Saccharimonadales bacterium]